MKVSGKFLLSAATLIASTGVVSAQSTSILPPFLQNMFDILGSNAYGSGDKLTATITAALYIILGAIILVAVIYSILAGIKYIRSEGEPGKIEEAQKAIKAILMGVASIFVGIIGIVLIYAFVGQSILQPSFQQVCLSAPSSIGCKRSSDQGANDPIVKFCVTVYSVASSKEADGTASFPSGIRPNLKAVSNAATTLAGSTWETDISAALTKDGYTLSELKAGALSPATLGVDNAAQLCLDPLNGGFYLTK